MPFPHEARSPISPSKRENHALSMATTPQAPIGSSNRERNFSNSPKPRLPTDHQGSDATKTETKWRASEDIRPKGWEEHKESEAVHKREQEKSLKKQDTLRTRSNMLPPPNWSLHVPPQTVPPFSQEFQFKETLQRWRAVQQETRLCLCA